MPVPAFVSRETLEDFTALYTAFCEANWHPADEPPVAVMRWLSVAHILLSSYRAAIEELEALEERADGH